MSPNGAFLLMLLIVVIGMSGIGYLAWRSNRHSKPAKWKKGDAPDGGRFGTR